MVLHNELQQMSDFLKKSYIQKLADAKHAVVFFFFLIFIPYVSFLFIPGYALAIDGQSVVCVREEVPHLYPVNHSPDLMCMS